MIGARSETGAIPSPGRAGVLVCGGNAEIGW
jgi:hypothetical protein